jgi:hypothetical protein
MAIGADLFVFCSATRVGLQFLSTAMLVRTTGNYVLCILLQLLRIVCMSFLTLIIRCHLYFELETGCQILKLPKNKILANLHLFQT